MTSKEKLLHALKENGESSKDLEAIFYQPIVNEELGSWSGAYYGPPIRISNPDDLPKREFNDDYGALEGNPVIAYTKKYVYICVQYDGSEWMEAIPRHPEYVGETIPWPGG